MATVAYTKIYSNDGSTVLFTSSQRYASGGGASATVTETGVTFPDGVSTTVLETYTYSGNKKFLGISMSANATTPTYAIGDTFTLGVESGSLYVVEEEAKEYTLRIDGVEVTDYENVIVNGVSYKCKKGANVPTDLSGYTVSVPAGWSVSSRYGLFILSYEFNGLVVNEGYLYLGYNIIPGDGPTGAPNYIYIGGSTLTPNDSFLVTFYNGQDITNQDLIQWFVDNGATFTKPELITFTIDGTQYNAEEGMTWGEWCNSSYNTYGYVIDYNGYIAAGVGHDYVAFSGSLVKSTDVIINNKNYTHHDVGTGGSN